MATFKPSRREDVDRMLEWKKLVEEEESNQSFCLGISCVVNTRRKSTLES